jgi:hypothetical protein
MLFAWFLLSFLLGVAGGAMTAEIFFFPVALAIPFALVHVATKHGRGIGTLLAYCCGFEAAALWVGFPAVFPSSFATPDNRPLTLAFALALALIGALIALPALLPPLRRWIRPPGVS